ncbi:hypothetical protein CPLU01_15285 [Colletotrichum plurivorum]|uniref:Uncharacterized protein n=1 Tax=Colletotrichum plurivorum TaxID=2175906 RepID=A0A8H6JCI3_9PEZI|nr:hypothetical protein CPLU01_15285 [Colletotrichum plurivorum]
METDGSDCPEGGNSTYCLLRTLLHLLREQRQADDAETNWDPITFWFTLVIGVAAALIAVVTALQAILAASRGRRKTNERAIGKWSRQTETHRSWRDMSVQSTTWTPVLRTDTLVKWHKSSPNENNISGGDGQSRFHIIVRAVAKLAALRERLATLLRKLFDRPRRIQPSAATWLGFFDQLGLTEVYLPGNHTGLRQTVANYLPDDLIAAPAHAQFGVIIASAAAAGARFQYIEVRRGIPSS